jgi:PAS domain S-box-containing protein
MQLVLSKVTDGVIATDAECRITGLNATAQHVTGWTSEEATGRRLHDILRVSAASLTHGALTDDQHLTLPDATVLVGREREHPISGSVSAVLDDNGELAGLILLFRETMPGGGRDAADNPARRAEILSEAITDLVTSSEPESTVCTVLAKVAAHLGVDSFFNYMVDDDQTNQLRLHACAGVSDAARIALERLQFGEGICGMVAQTRESIHATDIQRGEFEPAALVRGLNIQAYACHPLMVSDRVLGTLSFASRSRSAFRDDELHFMRQVTQHVAIVLDRVRTEKKLRESERRYRSVVEGQSEMVCRFRVNGSILFANEAYARSLGTSAAALEGANFWDYIKPDEHQHVRDQLARLSPNEPELQIENHFTTASGLRWTLWTNRALKFDEHGRVLEAQSAGIDITERKAAEQALLDSERRATNAFREIQATYDQSPIGMLQLDRDLRYVRINDQMAAMNGRTVAEHIGRTIHEIVPDLVPHIEPGFRRVLDTGEPVIGIELKGLTAADPGVEHTWLESWYPLREATGAIVGVNVVAQDSLSARQPSGPFTNIERFCALRSPVLGTLSSPRIRRDVWYR